MKKITSAAGLGLRLTFFYVLVVFGLVGIIQVTQIWLALQEAHCPSFRELWDEHTAFLGGKFGLLWLVVGLYMATADRKGQHTAYTLRRLPISEGAVTAIWGLMFAGWFVLYWAFQAGLGLVCYRLWAQKMELQVNLLFVMAHSSAYLHFLLPLSEPWAVARNIVMCLCFGGFAALSGTSQRHGRGAPLFMFLLTAVLWIFLWPNYMASQESDQALVILTPVCLLIDIFWTWRCIRNEEN